MLQDIASVSQATGVVVGPRNAQPPITVDPSRRKFGSVSNNRGNTTSEIKHRDAHAPAQKCGPAPKAMDADASCVTSK